MLTVRLCAAGLSFVAFATALMIGLVSGNDYLTIVTRALTSMFVFYVLGTILGRIGQIAIEESFEREKQAIEEEIKAEFEHKKSSGNLDDEGLAEVSSDVELIKEPGGAEKSQPVGSTT